jgi:hypothetical protein
VNLVSVLGIAPNYIPLTYRYSNKKSNRIKGHSPYVIPIPSHRIASSHHRGKRYFKRREKKHYSFFGVGRHTTKVTKYFDLLREGTGGEGRQGRKGVGTRGVLYNMQQLDHWVQEAGVMND